MKIEALRRHSAKQSKIKARSRRRTKLTLTLSLPLATIVDTVPVPLATKVDRTPSVLLAMIVAVFTNVRGIACFQIFTLRNPALRARKSAAKKLRVMHYFIECSENIQCHYHLRL